MSGATPRNYLSSLATTAVQDTRCSLVRRDAGWLQASWTPEHSCWRLRAQCRVIGAAGYASGLCSLVQGYGVKKLWLLPVQQYPNPRLVHLHEIASGTSVLADDFPNRLRFGLSSEKNRYRERVIVAVSSACASWGIRCSYAAIRSNVVRYFLLSYRIRGT